MPLLLLVLLVEAGWGGCLGPGVGKDEGEASLDVELALDLLGNLCLKPLLVPTKMLVLWIALPFVNRRLVVAPEASSNDDVVPPF